MSNSSSNKKNYKLLNSSHHTEDDANDDYENTIDLLPINQLQHNNGNNVNSNNRIEIDSDIDGHRNNEGEDEEDTDNLATSSTTLFQKIKNNLSSSFRNNKNNEETPIVENQEEEEDDDTHIDYSYYTDDIPTNNTNNSNNTSTTTTITNTNNISSSGQQNNQIPLYSINSMPTWFVRSNDPYSLENHIINHMRSNSRIEVLQQQQQRAESLPEQQESQQNNNTPTFEGIFRPFSSHFLSEQRQLSDQQNNLIKEKDIIIIQQPNNRLSIGFSDSKFTNYLKTGEHNPSGFYNSFIQNDEMLQRLALLTSPNANGGGANDGDIDNLSEISDLRMYQWSYLELEKRKKLFLSLLCIQLFYYFILLSSFTSFNPLIVFLFVGTLNNILALVSTIQNSVLGLSVYLCLELIMLALNYFVNYTTLFILRALIFMIGYKLRHEMLMFQTSHPSIF
ncbi:hypothetical protein RB653_004357 [Dictyostelium firmibasis]|uniref:Transmembrane protein n=1 Tax=Dictyostelium firmibasis TaxID=79012 RepID=A0AAN7YXX4_9MYCE